MSVKTEVEIVRLTGPELTGKGADEELGELLVDAVRGGASLGFVEPFGLAEAAAWWAGLAPAVDEGRLVLWAARAGDRLVGTVSLAFETKPNGRHRGEVLKLMVHREARGRGIARALLATAERAAAGAGVTLLLLDTEKDSGADYLYRATGWTPYGEVPDYATGPSGVLKPCSFFYKELGAGG